jgi:hypothetical protein
MSLNFIALSSTSFQITLQLLLQIIKHVQILVFSVDVSKFLKNSRCRIRPIAVLKSFSISEVTLHNENVLLESEPIANFNSQYLINNDSYYCNDI